MMTFAEKIRKTEPEPAKRGDIKRKSAEPSPAAAGYAAHSAFPIQRKAACACGGGCPICQTKSANLAVSHPADASEIEADRAADRVMRMPAAITSSSKISVVNNPVQPKSLAQTITPLVQPKRDAQTNLSSGLDKRINSAKTGGNTLDGGTRSFMQNRFGADFGGVKVHTGSEAVHLSNELSAKAFTVGSDIYFNEGQYQPHSESGRHLLAHELTHTIQQQPHAARKMIQRLPKEVSSSATCGTFVSEGTAIVTNKAEGGEIPYHHEGIPVKEGDEGSPLKVGGKTIKLADGDEVEMGQIGYKYWRAVCLKVSDRKTPEIFWVRASGLMLKKKEAAKPPEEKKGAFEELAGSVGTIKKPKPEYEPHATKEINKMGKMSSDIKSYDDVKTTGKIIRSVPAPDAKHEIARIKYNELLFVRASNSAGDWLYVATIDGGRQGWTQKDFVAENIPDQNATLHHTPNRDPLEPILANHYRQTDPYDIKTGDDLRILAMAVYVANKDDGRVTLDRKQFETDLKGDFKDMVDPWNEENRKVYRSMRVGSANIWLPGTNYVKQLKGDGTITTRPDWMSALIDAGKIIGGFGAGIFAGFFGGIWDMFKGLYELAKGIVEIVGKVFSGEIVKDLENLYDAVKGFIDDVAADPEKKLKEIITAISDALWGAATDFYDKWTKNNLWDKWFFRGEIVGMICLEVVMFLLTGGAANAAKWIAKLAKYAPKLVKFLERLIKGVDAVTPDVLKKKTKHKGDLDIEPDDNRSREKLTALTLAKGITEANDIKDTDATILIGFLQPLALKYNVKFTATPRGGERFDIDMIASKHSVKRGYTEKKKTASVGAGAASKLDDFSNAKRLRDGNWIDKPIKPGDPLPDGYNWNDGKIFRKSGKVDENYAPLGVEKGKLKLRELPDRISNPATMNRNYRQGLESEIRAKNPKWNDAQVKAAAAKQIDKNAVHHLIPDELVRSHPLADAARKQGYNLDDANNLKGLPKSKDLTDIDGGEIGHWSNHPKYTEMVKAELDAVEKALVKKHGSLDKVPKAELLKEMKKIEDKFRGKFDSGDIPTKDGRLSMRDEETEETQYA